MTVTALAAAPERAAATPAWQGGDAAGRVEGRRPAPLAVRQPAGGAGLLAAVEQHVVIALQPVVEAATGSLAGVEALLRGQEALGHPDPESLLDAAAAAGVLGTVERVLARRAIAAFARLPGAAERRLFLNLDARTLAEPGCGLAEELPALMRAAGLPPAVLCVELSERHPVPGGALAAARLRALREAGVRLAADDYGMGAAWCSLLFAQPLDYLKVDGRFVQGVAGDVRRRLFLASIAQLGRLLGLQVVAEGVEEEADLLVCRELGFDLLQGWLPGRPSTDPAALGPVAGDVARVIARDQRRQQPGIPHQVLDLAEALPPVAEDTPIGQVLDLLRREPRRSAVPVVDALGLPLGVVLEGTLRGLAYAPCEGGAPSPRVVARHLVTRCPVAELGSELEAVLQAAAEAPGAAGVILTERGRYRAWLPAAALLAMVNERRLAAALDQNPLTRLPGNRQVAQEVAEAAAAQPHPRLLCWFDFDGFKPFNDRFGFRLGDRAIVLFAEALQRHFPPGSGRFLGHVGGDDFFASFRDGAADAVEERIPALLAEFCDSAAHLYPLSERAAGFATLAGRDGARRRVPLLRCSAAMLRLPAGAGADPDALSAAIAVVKKQAKAAADGVALGNWDAGRAGRDQPGD